MERLKSRKLWMAIVSAVLIVLNEGLGWNVASETVLAFAAVILGYIFGQSYVDGHENVIYIDSYEFDEFEDDDEF